MKVAIVHDALVNRGGAERVLGSIHEMFPQSPIYTTVHLQERTHDFLNRAKINTTILQKIAKTETQLKLLFPFAFELMRRLDLSGFDVVLSSSTYCAKNVEVSSTTSHICYCYAPFRPVWEYDQYTANLGWSLAARRVMRAAFAIFRKIDFNAGQKPKHLIAISKYASGKLERAYNRRCSAIIYPPVDVGAYRYDSASENYFLVVSRLAAYKRIDIVVEAFNALQIPLKIVGDGPELPRLRNMAKPNIEFLGSATEADLRDYYARCRALLLPGAEDFGLTPLEAQASGKPVIAFAQGGALETVVGANFDNEDSQTSSPTGVFFEKQTPEAVINAVRRFERLSFDRDRIRGQALMFDVSHFQQRMLTFITQVYSRTFVPETWMSPQLGATLCT
jgi:glycosyltransferase involved in cell wall biosynthesis